MAVFLLFYVVYILMSIILLLNLLIALLDNTFLTTYNAASLEWRERQPPRAACCVLVGSISECRQVGLRLEPSVSDRLAAPMPAARLTRLTS